MARIRSRRNSHNSGFDSAFNGLEPLEDRHMLSAGLELIASYAGSWDASDNWLGVLDFSNPANRNANYVHKIDLRMQANDFAPGQDFVTVVFDIVLSSHLTDVSGWTPVGGQYNPGIGPLRQILPTNIDLPPTGDLQAIQVAVSGANEAWNRQYGEASRPAAGLPDSLGYPTLLGSVNVKWDGSPTMLIVRGNPVGGSNWATYDNNAAGDDRTMVSHDSGLTTQGVGFLMNEAALVSVQDKTFTEGNSGTSNMDFVVALTNPIPSDVTFDFTTFLAGGDTAVAGEDFTSVTRSAIILAGQTSVTVSVPVIGDMVQEDTETFHVQISNALHAGIDVAQAIGTILDTDPAPNVTINDPSQAEGSGGGTTSMPFTVSLSAASSRTITINYATVAGTAVAPDDFVSTSGTLTFAPGQTSRTVNVTVVADSTVERSESFQLVLSNAVNATITKDTGTATITNDDVPPPDAFEPDDTSAAASTIVPDGASQDHTLSSSGDQDWVKFVLATAADVTVSTSGTMGDTRLWLYRDSNLTNEIAFNDNNGDSKFSRLTHVLAPGTYYIKVDDGGNDSVLASYSLAVTTAPTNLIVFGGLAKTKATFTDSNNVAVQIYLKGPGDGEVWLSQAGSGNALRIITNNTTLKSSLVIVTPRGTATTVRDITVEGPIGSIIGKTTSTDGDVRVSGTLKKLQLVDTSGEHVLSVGAPATTTDRLSLVLLQAHDLSVRSDTPIKTISAFDWTNTYGGAMSIRTPFISKISSKGAFAPDVVLSGLGLTTTYTLGSASIAGSVTGDWTITGSAGSISVKGTLQDSVLRTTGNMSSVSLGAAVNSSVLAGIRGDVTTFPTIADHFTNVSTIKSLKITGWSVPRGTTLPRLLTDSFFAANCIWKVSLRNATDPLGLVVLPGNSTIQQISTLKYVDTIDSTKNTSWRLGQTPVPSLIRVV